MMSADEISRSQGLGRMRKFFGPMGTVSRVTVESEVLKSNMLGDPSARVVDVYTLAVVSVAGETGGA